VIDEPSNRRNLRHASAPTHVGRELPSTFLLPTQTEVRVVQHKRKNHGGCSAPFFGRKKKRCETVRLSESIRVRDAGRDLARLKAAMLTMPAGAKRDVCTLFLGPISYHACSCVRRDLTRDEYHQDKEGSTAFLGGEISTSIHGCYVSLHRTTLNPEEIHVCSRDHSRTSPSHCPGDEMNSRGCSQNPESKHGSLLCDHSGRTLPFKKKKHT